MLAIQPSSSSSTNASASVVAMGSAATVTINDLPPEILEQIFELSHQEYGRFKYTFLTFTQLAKVCKAWRNVLLGSRRFWKTINHSTNRTINFSWLLDSLILKSLSPEVLVYGIHDITLSGFSIQPATIIFLLDNCKNLTVLNLKKCLLQTAASSCSVHHSVLCDLLEPKYHVDKIQLKSLKLGGLCVNSRSRQDQIELMQRLFILLSSKSVAAEAFHLEPVVCKKCANRLFWSGDEEKCHLCCVIESDVCWKCSDYTRCSCGVFCVNVCCPICLLNDKCGSIYCPDCSSLSYCEFKGCCNNFCDECSGEALKSCKFACSECDVSPDGFMICSKPGRLTEGSESCYVKHLKICNHECTCPEDS